MAVPPPPGPLAQCRGRASREDCRAEGSIPTPGRQARCLVSTHRGPRGPMRSEGLETSDASPSWTRMVPSTATVWCIVPRSDAATGGPQAAPTQLGPCPPDADSDWACRSDRPAPLQRTRGRAPGTDPRAAGPCAGMAMTASECTSRPARARPAGVKNFQARQLVCSHHREPTLIHITDLFPTVLLSHPVSGQFSFCTASAPNITHTSCRYD